MSDYSGFAERLEKACEQSMMVPAHREGRQAVLARALGISDTAVSRYFKGTGLPRPELMTVLATFLGVDEAWLALGIDAGAQPKRPYQFSEKADGGAYVAFGLFMSAGYQCTMDTEPGPVDFFASKAGKQFGVSAVLAENQGDGQYMAKVRNASHDLLNLCVLPESPTDFAILIMDNAGVEQFAEATPDALVIPVVKNAGHYHTQGKEWHQLKDSGLIG